MYILFSIICLYSCSQGSSSINDDSKKIDLDNRNYLLTKKELSGTYKGNKTDQKFDLNTAVKTIPTSFFAGFAKVTEREFYEVEDPQSRNAPKVTF